MSLSDWPPIIHPPPPLPEPFSQESDSRSVSKVKEIINRKLKERGYPVPPPPPLSPQATNHPYAVKILEEGGEMFDEKFSKCLIKHACGTKVTKMDSRGIRLSEVEALKFVAENTTIPVPTVAEVGDQYFTMNCVEGETLEKAWDGTLSEEDRQLVRRQMRDYLEQMRAIKSPGGVICTFGNRPAIDSRMFFEYGGPFTNESDYNDFLVSDLHAFVTPATNILRSQLRELEPHEIVFTHGDLHAINIIARPGEGIVAVIDWELAGYYPEYLDFVKPFRPAMWKCGYYQEFHDFFPKKYEREYMIDQLLSTYTRH